jgi:hypothetical protein
VSVLSVEPFFNLLTLSDLHLSASHSALLLQANLRANLFYQLTQMRPGLGKEGRLNVDNHELVEGWVLNKAIHF